MNFAPQSCAMFDRTTWAVIAESAGALLGLVVLWRCALQPRAKAATVFRLPPWAAQLPDFLTFLLFTLVLYVAGGLGGALVCKPLHLSEDERLIFLTAAAQLGMLAGPVLYAIAFRQQFGLTVGPVGRSLVTGAATFLVSMPFVFVIGFVWSGVMKAVGLPVEKQPAIELFTRTKEHGWLSFLIIVAVVMAPVAEELIFRAGLFRYFRTRIPRWAAFVLPACLFAALHQNLASFGQLLALAIVFSAAYERTGEIGTSIVAHALFNLNTVILLLLGVDI
jgi:uncharacterized protein